MSRANLRNRLDALFAQVRPRGSISARVAALSDGQRAEWHRHEARLADWHCRYPGAAAFEALLEGFSGPPLRRDVQHALSGPVLAIPSTATVEDAAQIYRKMLEGN